MVGSGSLGEIPGVAQGDKARLELEEAAMLPTTTLTTMLVAA